MDCTAKELKTKSIFMDTTLFYADSVEWCPIEEGAEFMVCGNYQLEEHLKENETCTDEAQTRKGAILLYKMSFSVDGETVIQKQDTVYCSGVLDMKWCPIVVDNILLAVAGSNGCVLLFKLHIKETGACLEEICHYNLAETNIKNMVLSLDWSCQNDGLLNLIASDTSGSLNYFELRNRELILLQSWKCHDFESWISAFDYSQQNVVYSGGDDCCFKRWDVRSPSNPTFVNRRHSMGVTAISKCKLNENLLATGSYDENVFLWDTRLMKSPISEISLGGGIWRIKWHPFKPDYLVTASMHNGFHVLSATDLNVQVIAHYKDHESLAYGVDWCNIRSAHNCSKGDVLENTCSFVASCSFYDRLLKIWKINF